MTHFDMQSFLAFAGECDKADKKDKIVLLNGTAKNTYDIIDKRHNYNPHATIYVLKHLIDKHFIIKAKFVNYNFFPPVELEEAIGIAHNEEELPEKVYESAKKFAKVLAEEIEFEDQTKQAKPSKLEQEAKSP